MTAEELLNSISKNQVSVLSEDDGIFAIDAESRTITVPDSERLFGVEGDKDVERKYFQCPKIVGDNIDLSQHQIYVSYVFTTTENNTAFPTIGNGLYHCEDVEVSGDNITFSWLLSGNVFANPGFIAFKVMAKKSEGGELKTKWNTAPAIGTVLLTVPDGEEIAEEYPDIINQLLTKMESVEQIATPEAMQGYVNAYLEENPVTGGMTEEQEQQLNKNTEDISSLSEDKLDLNQGKENSGKAMVVGEDGALKPEDITVSVDTTLSKEGEAADAKTTGEKIDEISKVAEKAKYFFDSEGNKYSATIIDGNIVLENVPELFPGKEIVSYIDMSEVIPKDGDNLSYVSDQATNQVIHGYNQGILWGNIEPFKDYKTNNFNDFETTMAFEIMISNKTNAYAFVQHAKNKVLLHIDEVNAGYRPGITHFFYNSGEMKIVSSGDEFIASLSGIPYIKTDGSEGIYDWENGICYKKQSDVSYNSNGWTEGIYVYVFESDGNVNFYYGEDLMYKFESPSDFKTWNFKYAVNDKNATERGYNYIYQYKQDFIIINDSIGIDDIKKYNDYLMTLGAHVTKISSSSYICINKGAKYNLYVGIEPKSIEPKLAYQSSNKNVAIVDQEGEITALNDGTSMITVSSGDISVDIPIYVGRQVSPEDSESIEELSTRNITDIILVNEDDVPESFDVGDEFCLYAIGINTEKTIPYSVFDQNMLNFSSDNSDVCSVMYGVIHANSEGTANITISPIDGTVTKNLQVTVKNEIDNISAHDTLYVNDRDYGIYNNGTNPESTTDGIKNVLNYATENEYNKIVFNPGEYIIDPTKCPIILPSEMTIDFSGATLRPQKDNTHIISSEPYTILSIEDCKNLKLENLNIYAENYDGDKQYHVEQCRSVDIQGSCENITIKNCELSYSPGFNLALGTGLSYSGQWALVPFKLDNVEPGNISDDGNVDNDNVTDCYRSKDFIDISVLKNNMWGLGNMQGYQGYVYMTARLYNIYWYDDSGQFISFKKYCVQYQQYKGIPDNAKKCKIVFFQDTAPTSSDPDYHGIAHLYTLKSPYNIRIKNCIFKENVSTGISPQGGRWVQISDCTFFNSGYLDPASSIDWEDGRIHMQGHIVRNCNFGRNISGACQIISSNSRDIAFHDNYVDDCMFTMTAETQNNRIYRNKFLNNNISIGSKGDCIFYGNVYTREPTYDTDQVNGGNIIALGNKKI